MGLFDGFKQSVQPALNTQQAIMTIVIYAITVDGSVSDDEAGRLRSMCARSPIFSMNSREEDDKVIEYSLNVCNQLGVGALQKAAEVLKPELKETAFAFATEMVLADGIVGEKEDSFITQLASILQVHEGLARSIIEVTLIRGRG